MPRRRVTVQFQKARPMRERRSYVHPSWSDSVKKPSGLSPLAQYIEENRESGLSIQELIEQFQEFDCEHRKDSVAASAPNYIIVVCPDCGRTEKRER